MCSVKAKSGRARIVEAALAAFGERGIAATSLREVAAAAGVSPALIVHHFGGKEGLVAAADDVAIRAFAAAYADPGEGDGETTLRLRAEQTAGVMRERPEVCAYIGRALVEGTAGGGRLFDAMIDAGGAEIERLAEQGALRPDADRLWATLQHFFLIWAPLGFGRVLEGRLGGRLVDPPNLERWVEANLELLGRGLYR